MGILKGKLVQLEMARNLLSFHKTQQIYHRARSHTFDIYLYIDKLNSSLAMEQLLVLVSHLTKSYRSLDRQVGKVGMV